MVLISALMVVSVLVALCSLLFVLFLLSSRVLWREPAVTPRVVVRNREYDVLRCSLFYVAGVIILELGMMFAAMSGGSGGVVPSLVVVGDVLLAVAVLLLVVMYWRAVVFRRRLRQAVGGAAGARCRP